MSRKRQKVEKAALDEDGPDLRGGNGGEDQEYPDFSYLELRPHHEDRPIWVCPDGHIFLEAFSPIYQYAYDFLIAISEPVARPTYVHEYKLTAYSLYAAAAVNIRTQHILSTLTRFSKNKVPVEVENFIRRSTETYGKAKLLLRNNEYYIEAESKEVARLLLKNDVIKEARAAAEGTSSTTDFIEGEAAKEMTENIEYLYVGREDDDDQDPDVIAGTAPELQKTAMFRIDKAKVREVKEATLNMNPPYPLMEEYDFRRDTRNKNLDIDLKQTTKVRSYQQKSLRMMFGNGRARSGIIVLPCGAGKTLTGASAAASVRKNTIILCNSTVSVIQWKAEFHKWTTVPDKKVMIFTSKTKEQLPVDEACVLVTTYFMLGFRGTRSEETRIIMDQIKGREWGLMILDEVHVCPADSFQRVLDMVGAHAKLGLTATLVREDALINTLNSMVGPKLYEANWMDLTEQGYLANVQCVEAWCPMTAAFYQEYLTSSEKEVRELLYGLNPNKIRICEYLMRYHESRGDKIIIFSDLVYCLNKYAEFLRRKQIYGATKEKERTEILAGFRLSTSINTIFLSRVGDTSIDLPEANVIIQISSQYGSRRQEAQRLGRILRPKQTADEGFNAFFYTLVSTDTMEMRYATKRQQYLVDQGYTFKVLPNLLKEALAQDSSVMTRDKELDLLTQALADKNVFRKLEDEETAVVRKAEDEDAVQYGDAAVAAATVKRVRGSMSALSGGEGLSYMEYDDQGPRRKK